MDNKTHVILEVQSNPRQVYERLDTSLAELLGVTYRIELLASFGWERGAHSRRYRFQSAEG